ncbi:unnamed protein product [Diamesa tonsa]
MKGYSTLSIIKDEIFEEVRRLLTSTITSDDISPFVTVKEFYKKCINRTEIDLLEAAPLFEVINKIGSWPILNQNWNDNDFHWQKTLDEFYEHGFNTNYLLELSVYVDDRDATKNIIYVSQPWLNNEYNEMYYDFLQEGIANEKIKAYYEYMVELTSVLGANKKTNIVEMKQVLDFEIALNNISTSYEKLRDITTSYHYTTIHELQQKYPYMDWMKFVRTRIPKQIAIDDTEEVLYIGIDYLTEFGDLIKVTPKKTVANYLYWRIADLSVNFLSKKLQVVKLKFHEELSGNRNLDEGWKKCVTEAVVNLQHAVSAMYTQKKTQNKDKDNAVKLVESLKETTKQLTDESYWMNKTEKNAIQNMLDKVQMLIGFPNEYLNDSLLIDYHNSLTFDDNITYFNAILDMRKFSIAKQYKTLRENVNDSEWEGISDITVVSSKFSTTDSFITIPVAYLRAPFYSATTQAYLNYAGLGVDAGYLFSYAVDNMMLSLKSTFYRNTTNCVVKKYEKYMKDVHNLTINANDASRRLMSANGSFKVGYFSYKKWQKLKSNTERRLPGLNYTAEQLYWIASAQIYCNKDRPEEFIRKAAVLEHAVEQFRVIGSFQNLPEFSQDFHCPLGSYMNPVEKCQIF